MVVGEYAGEDGYLTPEMVFELEAQLQGLGKDATMHVHEGADHAFFNDSRPDVYHADTRSRRGSGRTSCSARCSWRPRSRLTDQWRCAPIRCRAVRRVLILAIPAVLVLGACSSDDDDELEVTLPDVTLPDVTLPDVTLPDMTLPDITLPDITLPDLTMPDLTLPDFSFPES